MPATVMAEHGQARLDATDRRIVDGLQGDFPLVSEPYRQAAARLGIAEDELLGRLDRLLGARVLTRFGPMFQVERMGGRFVLAALAAPEARFDEVAESVNRLPEVAHNYRREHRLNMWFVLATERADGIDAAIRRIEADTGLPVYAFPKEREYFVDMRLTVRQAADPEASGAGTVTAPETAPSPATAVRGSAGPSLTRSVVVATQAGLPLVRQPYRLIADQLGCDEVAVIGCLAAMLESGAIRRIGAVPNHYAIGYVANGMSVWDVPDDAVDRLGQEVGALPFVTHCYRRPRALPDWPFNLFAMVHGGCRDEVLARVAEIRAHLHRACRRYDVLFSSRILKKTGLRIGG